MYGLPADFTCGSFQIIDATLLLYRDVIEIISPETGRTVISFIHSLINTYHLAGHLITTRLKGTTLLYFPVPVMYAIAFFETNVCNQWNHMQKTFYIVHQLLVKPMLL